jgi:small-conductance mechanosensitive channel
MDDQSRARRWPAYGVAVLFLAYAVGKAVFAAQSRLGFPGGPVVSAAEHESYARDVMDVATAQWSAAASGLLAACLAVATVTTLARRVPRPLMLLVLAGMLLAGGAGAAIMAVDGFIGIGVGWQWYHGLVGLVAIGLLLEMIRSYAKSTRRVAA